MPLVRVKQKFQVTIPDDVRRRVGLEVGDMLEASTKNNMITLRPKIVVDRHPAIDARLREGLADIKAGRVYGPFDSAKDLVRDLRSRAKPAVRKAAKKKP